MHLLSMVVSVASRLFHSFGVLIEHNTAAVSTKRMPTVGWRTTLYVVFWEVCNKKGNAIVVGVTWQAEFEQKQVDMREQVVKFEKFIQENDAKRIRAEAKAKQVGCPSGRF